MDAIQITNLTKKYGDFTAVDNLDLTIGQGELFSLLGVNGAGKTTTIEIHCPKCKGKITIEIKDGEIDILKVFANKHNAIETEYNYRKRRD